MSDKTGKPLRFPCSRTEPAHTQGGPVELGITDLARQLVVNDESLFGHWCSRCHGVWYGLPLEAQCPVCGNRHG